MHGCYAKGAYECGCFHTKCAYECGFRGYSGYLFFGFHTKSAFECGYDGNDGFFFLGFNAKCAYECGYGGYGGYFLHGFCATGAYVFCCFHTKFDYECGLFPPVPRARCGPARARHRGLVGL